jgi:AcrR family transcriptional regulator
VADVSAPDRLATGSAPPTARPRRGAATRERIMSSAADLFAEGGYDATSVHAIAARAGITVAAIYRHFRSKDELLIAVAKAALTTTDLAQLPSAGDDPVEQVTALVLAFARPDRYRTRRLAIELSQAATRHPEVARALRRFHATSRAALAEVLSAGQRDGRIDAAADPDALARTILLLIMGLTHIDALDDRLAADEAWRESLRSDVRHLLGTR